MIRETSRTTSFSIRARQAPATPVARRPCLAARASPPVPCLVESSTRVYLRRSRGQRHFYNEQSWKCVSEASSAAALLHFGLHFALWFHIAVRDSTCRLTCNGRQEASHPPWPASARRGNHRTIQGERSLLESTSSRHLQTHVLSIAA